MKVNIYYGGRGIIEDPTINVCNRIATVLDELRVEVGRYNLFEQKNEIAKLAGTIKDVDAVILAVNVEWLGIGGLMAQFLDACWLYADKSKLKNIYMMPVVISMTVGEREAMLTLIKAWERLGGVPCRGICAYVEDAMDFETSDVYMKLVEDCSEDLYRTVSQKRAFFPSSTNCSVTVSSGLELTPQEGEQLSELVSNDNFVKKQKEDIKELSSLFREKIEQGRDEDRHEFISNLKENFKPVEDFSGVFAITMTDIEKTLVVEVEREKLHCFYGDRENADVTATTTRDVVNRLVNGRTTFQGAFMSGAMTAKGEFKNIRIFDQLFQFNVL
ncbi:MAG: SCP2 sterol-binding domain-containing protein [Lachnospiraceae bacterium]|nr:SCP2 sterol-binding domain-containing protein [Lachnospiraceae bacterium]